MTTLRRETRCSGSGYRGRICVTGLVLVLASLSACLTPPVLITPPYVDFERASKLFPGGTESIEIPTDDGATLRGVFVTAEEGAPVVLHLLESAGSVGSLFPPKSDIARDFANLGFSSLLVDYRGVGISPGEASAEHLDSDARAMWAEAVRRAGAPERVIVRAHSIGTVALGVLLESGIRPGAIVALSPVDAGKVVRRFAREFYGWWASIWAAVAYRPVADVDVYGELTSFEGPILYLVAESDELISTDERERLREDANGTFVMRPGDHLGIGLYAQVALTEEVRFFAEEIGLPDRRDGESVTRGDELPAELLAAFRTDPDARARFEELRAYARREPLLSVAATARQIDDPITAYRWLRILSSADTPPPLDACRNFLSLEDPGGELDLLDIAAGWRLLSVMDAFPGCLREGTIATWLRTHLPGLQLDDAIPPISWRYSWEDEGMTFTLELERDLRSFAGTEGTMEGAKRRLARIFLKASGIPDRVVPDSSGVPILEIWRDGTWRPLSQGFTIKVSTEG
jgi:pimeloyl-ACP methyl ester carboxylesterase